MFAAVFIFYDGKKPLVPFLILVFMLWTALDFTALSGWVFAVPAFMGLYYITRVVLMIFCLDTDKLKNILPAIFVVHFLLLFVIFNLFMR